MCMFVTSPHSVVVHKAVSQRHTTHNRNEEKREAYRNVTDLKPGPEQCYEGSFTMQVEVSV